MSDNLPQSVRELDSPEYALAQPSPALAQAVADIRRSVDRHYVPSGISGFTLHADDHIALFVLPGSPEGAYLSIILGYVAAGMNDMHRDEAVVLELSESVTVDRVTAKLDPITSTSSRTRVDIVDWDRNSGDYTPEHFDVYGMWRAILNQRPRLEGVRRPTFRCASEDCSFFIRWLDNPYEYLLYESQLATDLTRLLPGTFLQMCTFKHDILSEVETAHGLDIARSVTAVLASHNRIIVTSGDGTIFDQAAVKYLLAHYRISWQRYRAQVIRAKLAELRARFSPRRYRHHQPNAAP